MDPDALKFRNQYIWGTAPWSAVDNEGTRWHRNAGFGMSLGEFLGFSDEEYSLFVTNPKELKRRLDEEVIDYGSQAG